MHFAPTDLNGVYEITPRIFHDERGFFFESYNQQIFEAAGLSLRFVQDNQSFSQPGVLRGLHFQRPPFAQGKLVRVLTGQAIDVVVDLRHDSPTFGQHRTFLLDAERQNMVYVPEGFAHGFLALADCIFVYKCTQFYDKNSEGGLRWNDPTLQIAWPAQATHISPKDEDLPHFDPQQRYF